MNATHNDRAQGPNAAPHARWLCACALLALCATGTAHAYNARCVTSVAQLKSAVADAVAATEFDIRIINIHVGTYQLDGDLEFITNNGPDAKEISVRGGWTIPLAPTPTPGSKTQP
jgi:hypothetical protein